jgi:hypothetical protein
MSARGFFMTRGQVEHLWGSQKTVSDGRGLSMNKAVWLKRVNVVLFFLLILQAVTALLSPVMSPEVFEVIHPVGGALLVMVALVHLGLNWAWVRSVVLKRKA